MTPQLPDPAVLDAERRLATARSEREELLAFARQVRDHAPQDGQPDGFHRRVLSALASEAQRLIASIAGDGPG